MTISSVELAGISIEKYIAATILILDTSLTQGGYADYITGYYVGMKTITEQNGTIHYVFVLEAGISVPPQ